MNSNWDIKTSYKPALWRSTVTAPLCALCNKTVYPAEELTAAGQKFHKLCLKCTTCNTLLNSGNLNEHEKKTYCVPCHRRQFGPQGVGRGLASTSSFNADMLSTSPRSNTIEMNLENHRYQRKISTGSSPSRTSSDDDSRHISGVGFKMMSISQNICPRCSKTVYSAEEVKAAGKSFHKRCYSCAHCKGSISGGRYSEHDGELYDNNCYQRLFGPEGRCL
ncbi:hypothetical protein I4U23_013443 [Adineta vaga]|nr:hypothetical protein I4U23_013443 [Adineta vaga]